jgi:hypothetical protein
MNGAEEFARQLKELDCNNVTIAGNHVVFDYTVPGGRLKGRDIRLGFEVPPEFPRNPPGGPHLSPRHLPMNPGATGHPERVADSNIFGGDGQYLSRPFPAWKGSETVSRYLAYVDHLFQTT